MKRRLPDAGLLGRVAQKERHLTRANKRKRLRSTKEHKKKVLWTYESKFEVLQEARGKISSDYFNKLTARMPTVCKAVIAAKGEFVDESKV